MADETMEGWEGCVKIHTADPDGQTAIEWVQDVSVDFKNNVSEIYEMGNRLPQELKASNINIDAVIDELIEGTTIANYVIDTNALTEYYIGIYPEGCVSTRVKILLTGKFEGWSFSAGVGKIASEKLTFKGLTISVGAVP